ncbi:MraY family glycosyltransferase [Lactobacillus sp.]|uniref:glycosyltransferase family 4 protein n=1 Tax=Lactobacillus sp. TaxID=1591 RepID=UPI0019C03AFB|nr:MraY family glycosyltransferase [Lactobacillus sp.]MBD5430350.1 undecaprenyl/decaprenyl-phosphate alpha-N-acetylglucosaminyl 1-phosphate transferase [Lactobacillus sp.]
MFQIIVKIFLLVIISAAITPFIRRLAFVLGAVDNPNARRVNKKPMPTIGGLGIFVSFSIGQFVLLRDEFPTHELFSVLLASSVIILTGLIDDILELKPRQKMFGIFIASLVIYFLAGIKMSEVTLPWLGTIQLGWWSFPITIFWILALTNAINLIDGLDGLATGVSIISLITMGIVGFFFLYTWQHYVPIMCIMLAACLIGFLPYNFHPAKIFLGDTGALYIGFMIAILSLKGLKDVTFISLLVPIIILGVPITDTIYAMIRRRLNKQPISEADKHHLHHQLMKMGLSHRQTVLAIYGLSLIFSFVSLLSILAPKWGIIPLMLGLFLGLELFVETIGLLGERYKPLMHFFQKMINKMGQEDPKVEVHHLSDESKDKNKKDK